MAAAGWPRATTPLQELDDVAPGDRLDRPAAPGRPEVARDHAGVAPPAALVTLGMAFQISLGEATEGEHAAPQVGPLGRRVAALGDRLQRIQGGGAGKLQGQGRIAAQGEASLLARQAVHELPRPAPAAADPEAEAGQLRVPEIDPAPLRHLEPGDDGFREGQSCHGGNHAIEPGVEATESSTELLYRAAMA